MARILKVVGLIAAIAVLAAIVFLFVADLGFLKPRVEKAVSDATGRDFRIDGNFSVRALPVTEIHIEDASLANPAWASETTMLSVGRLSARISPWSILTGPVVIRDLELSDAIVNLETTTDGETNWSFGEPPEDAAEPAGDGATLESPLDLRHAEVRNVRVAFRRPEADDLLLVVDSFDVAEQASGARRFGAAATFNELPVIIDGGVADHLLDLAADVGEVKLASKTRLLGDSAEIDLSIGTLDKVGSLLEVDNLPADDLALKGDVALEGGLVRLSGIEAQLGSLRVAVDGTIDTSDSSVALSVSAAGENLDVLKPDLPQIPFAVEAGVTVEGKSVGLDPFEVTLDESVVTGSLHAVLDEVPEVELEARSESFDASPFFPAAEEAETEEVASDEPAADGGDFVFEDEPLPLDLLRKAKLDVEVQLERLLLPLAEYSDFVVRLALRDGALKLENGFVGELGGKLANAVTMEFDDSSADLEIRLRAEEMKLVSLAGENIAPDLVPASSINIDLTASGSTPHDLASSTNGKVQFLQGPGRIDNKLLGRVSGDILAQLFGALNPFSGDEQFSNWECSALQLDFDAGEGEIDTFLLQGEKIMVVGGGQIDMATERLNVEFNTKPRAGVGVSADMFVTPFVALTGTLSSPRVGLNAKGALLSGGAAVLTGGLSFLYQGLADRATAESGKCDETFEAIGEPMPGG